DPSTPGEGGLMWKVPLGSQTYGNPVVAGGKVFVGTNNGGEYRDHLTGDAGIVLCFDELTGEFLWQLGREKLPQGRVNDWPEQGICSTPCVEDGVMYVITNRCEVMAIDVEGFRDGENDGVYQEETHTEDVDADILWSVDMIDEYGVFPHNLATSSPVLYEGVLYLLTSNGVDEAHLEVPAPRAPSFLALSAVDGSLVWEAAEPSHLDDEDPGLFDNILHGQWSSPAIAVVDGNAQVLMPGGDGWLYAYETEPDADGFGQVIWKFDLNPKDSKWELGGRGTRNNIVSTPVVYEDSVILAVGQDPEHGEGVGHLYRIDASKTGDVSPTLVDADGNESPNPNSGEIWHYGGEDADGELIYRRTISTVAVADGLCFAPDLSGFVHVIDVATGERKWVYDMFAACWGSPMAVDGRVLIGDEDGELAVLPIDPAPEGLDDELNFEDPIAEIGFDSSIYSTPTIANGRMYVSDRSTLYCFEVK
ncbi:MAG: PQQ-binding-like beta-propeller repeat protein, partial [Planctomycetota bacterium]